MLVKRHLLLIVLAAALWFTLAVARPRQRPALSVHGSSLRKREYPTRYEAKPLNNGATEQTEIMTPPRPTTPWDGCYYNEIFYKNGDYIDQQPCYSMICLSGNIAIADIFCETQDGCNVNWKPNACCSLCQDTTPHTPDITSTKPPGC